MGHQADSPEPLVFEDVLRQLEDLVARLEGSEISLEESLKDFEQGVALVHTLRERLDQAQQRIDKIVEQEGGEPVAQPVSLADDPDSGEGEAHL